MFAQLIKPWYHLDVNFEKLFKRTLIHLGKRPDEHNVWLTFLSKQKMQDINLKIRNIDQPTDVLSIPLDFAQPNDAVKELGDIIICKSIARKKRMPLDYVYVHGLLHLLGYTHDTEEDYQTMHKITEDILK